MQNQRKLAAGLGRVATKVGEFLRSRLRDSWQSGAASPESESHPYSLLLPPNTSARPPRG